MVLMTVSDQPITEQGKQSFESAIQSLESIVLGLEDGDVELNDLVKKYKEGVELLKYCRAKVESAELTLKEVNKSKLILPDENLDDK
jgi:exodeoxyribonuclease VII small subunit